MNIYAIGCTHGYLPDPVEFEGADIIVHTGDIGEATHEYHDYGHKWIYNTFNPWLESLPVPKENIIVIPGNHDICFEQNPELINDISAVGLIDKNYQINDINFYGTPYTPTFGYWAFMEEDITELNDRFGKIPENTDVLISHGPPLGILDKTIYGQTNAGSVSLANKILNTKNSIELVLFSHIHRKRDDNKKEVISGKTFINCSYLNDDYIPVNDIVRIEI